ncbi:MAG TPA: NAD(P)H-binding protein [Candidatus Sulfotelmatobacter sp.]|nr:NAD(P)H-binding protein [Candidatus Sulfotelmatobacter sp.]
MTISIALEKAVVTGAFGYTGKYIARRLLREGKRVLTLTAHPNRPHEFGGRVEVAPLEFQDPRGLVHSLQGAGCLFNTYWVRFNHGDVTFDRAVENTRILVEAAREAGVRKLVHISVTNPSLDSELAYFRGKAELEKIVRSSGIPYAILRPTIIFGIEDILINNIAWLLRHFPVFALPGSARYRVQPVFVENVADLAIRASEESADSIRDAVGPEIFTFAEFVRLIAAATRSKARIIHVNSGIALALTGLLGLALRDRILTREEVDGLMADLLVSAGPPTGETRFSDWLRQHGETIGESYSSEFARHYVSS